VPIVICSATKRRDDQIIGLKLGADDFIAHPFTVDDLQARIELALQRTAARPASAPTVPDPDTIQRIGDLAIDQARCNVRLGGRELPLTPTEFRLLCAVARRPMEVVSRRDLADSVWGCHDNGVIRSLDVHMRRLRTKLDASGAVRSRLVIRRGFGYQLVDETGWPSPA
jgi:DNA-binding response OmpR family regulator